MAADGEVCTNDHEPKLGRCIYCAKIKACVGRVDLICGRTSSVLHHVEPCRGQIILFPYIRQPELQAAYRLGGIVAVEMIA